MLIEIGATNDEMRNGQPSIIESPERVSDSLMYVLTLPHPCIAHPPFERRGEAFLHNFHNRASQWRIRNTCTSPHVKDACQGSDAHSVAFTKHRRSTLNLLDARSPVGWLVITMPGDVTSKLLHFGHFMSSSLFRAVKVQCFECVGDFFASGGD